MGVRGKGCEPLGDKGLGRVEEKERVERKFSMGTPWLKIQDVSSLGRSTRLKGIKTGRQHEYLSDLERNYFYLTETIPEECRVPNKNKPK